jgi:hypothetical protein
MAGRSTKGRDRLRQRTCEVLCRVVSGFTH